MTGNAKDNYKDTLEQDEIIYQIEVPKENLNK